MASFDLTRRGFTRSLLAVPAAATPSFAQSAGQRLPAAWITLDAAEVKTVADTIVASTGSVRRTWKWTGAGLLTTGFKDTATGREWATAEAAAEADWSYPGLLGEGRARLARLDVRIRRFDPFTSDHIRVAARIVYPESKLELLFEAQVYPNAPGIRTQLSVRGMAGFTGDGISPQDFPEVDLLPVAPGNLQRRAIGYYNHTQRRNTRETEILRDEVTGDMETCGWASIMCLEDGEEGVCLVKESHKCVNQTGVNTGNFKVDAGGLHNTGWGPSPSDIRTDRARACWASWAVAYAGGKDGRELAIKRFDRMRFAVDPRRDIYVMANTWGSGGDKSESLAASREDNILKQIESCRDLGIDVQQIDDGWQGDNQYQTWFPVPEKYPEGWKNVRAAARQAGVKLGLWAAWGIGQAALAKTYEEGGFNYYKIDFARLDTYDKLESLMEKMKGLIVHSGNSVRVNWDVTENPPRVGYYYARDLGNIYLENRKPFLPAHVVYVPYLVLRDAWHVAHYTNLNRFQVTVQNPERVNREVSDAHLHSHPYCLAITLMGSPIFFQETTYYTPEARDQLRPLLALYKKHRAEMYRGYVFPIGEKPSNASWTGFQNHNPATGAGYLIVYRERLAPGPIGAIRLRQFGGGQVRVRDLVSGEQGAPVSDDGVIRLPIPRAPGFRFLRYEPV